MVWFYCILVVDIVVMIGDLWLVIYSELLVGCMLFDVGGGLGYFVMVFFDVGVGYIGVELDFDEMYVVGFVFIGWFGMFVWVLGMVLLLVDDLVDICLFFNVVEYVLCFW